MTVAMGAAASDVNKSSIHLWGHCKAAGADAEACHITAAAHKVCFSRSGVGDGQRVACHASQWCRQQRQRLRASRQRLHADAPGELASLQGSGTQERVDCIPETWRICPADCATSRVAGRIAPSLCAACDVSVSVQAHAQHSIL
jgi:hypothetical protein